MLLGDALRVENQHHAAVAEIGRADNARHLDQRVGQRAHDDLALADDAVDGEPDRRQAMADDEHVQRAAGLASSPNTSARRTIGSTPSR